MFHLYMKKLHVFFRRQHYGCNGPLFPLVGSISQVWLDPVGQEQFYFSQHYIATLYIWLFVACNVGVNPHEH